MLIKQNGKYGARVGNIQVFTMERAVEVYKMFAVRCYADLTMEASVVLSNVGEDMHRLGFTWAEIEDMELEAIALSSDQAPPSRRAGNYEIQRTAAGL